MNYNEVIFSECRNSHVSRNTCSIIDLCFFLAQTSVDGIVYIVLCRRYYDIFWILPADGHAGLVCLPGVGFIELIVFELGTCLKCDQNQKKYQVLHSTSKVRPIMKQKNKEFRKGK